MLRLGVIGGMGAEATSYYYEQVIQHTDAQNDQEHVEMIIWSCSSMPDRTRAIKTGEHDELLNKMHECATALENLGCRNIAIHAIHRIIFMIRFRVSFLCLLSICRVKPFVMPWKAFCILFPMAVCIESE